MVYYEAYEERYRRVYAAGAEYWGHTPDDAELRAVLAGFVERHGLRGRSVIEFMCGEGAGGVALSELGCGYLGVDLAESALDRARRSLAGHPNARVLRADATRLHLEERFDAGLDVMGIHMLVTDADRAAYLRNVHDALKPGAPLMLYHVCYRTDAWEGEVASHDEWLALNGISADEEYERRISTPQGDKTVPVRLLAARPQSRAGYERELNAAGFDVAEFSEDAHNSHIAMSATILAVRR